MLHLRFFVEALVFGIEFFMKKLSLSYLTWGSRLKKTKREIEVGREIGRDKVIYVF